MEAELCKRKRAGAGYDRWLILVMCCVSCVGLVAIRGGSEVALPVEFVIIGWFGLSLA